MTFNISLIDEGKVVFLSILWGKGIQDIILFTLFIVVHSFVKILLFQHVEKLFLNAGKKEVYETRNI